MPRAPRRCAGDDYTCPHLIRGTTYCPAHANTTTSWTSERSSSSRITSTRQWRKLRAEVLARDHHQCQIQLQGICTTYADRVDHIINTAAGGAPYDPSNCQAACAPCNQAKASQEQVAARRRNTRERSGWKRTPEPHPGLRR